MESGKVHSYFVKHLPFHQQNSTYLTNQRNILMYGPAYSIRLRREPELLQNTTSRLIEQQIPQIKQEELDRIHRDMPIHSQFRITKELLANFRTSLQTTTEEQFYSLLCIFLELEDYWSLYSLIETALESPILEALASKMAIQYVDLVVALDMGPHLVRTLLRKCRTSNRQERIMEDILRQLNATYTEAFRLDSSLKKEFPTLVVFIEGLLLQQAPSGSQMQSPVFEQNAPPSPSGQSIDALLSTALATHNIGQALGEFVSSRNGSVMGNMLTRRELSNLFNNCLERYLSNPNDRIITLLREMHAYGLFFNGTDLI
jgi:hypothetical protein